MRKLLLGLAIAGCIATPLALAQGRSGGGGPPSGSLGGSHMGSPMGASIGVGTHGSIGNTHMDVQGHSTLRGANASTRADAQTPEQAVFGLSTAERAKLLKDADLETRKAFGAYQASLAKAKAKAKGGEDVDAMTVEADSLTQAQLDAFGTDTQARAMELKGADRATRKAFGTFQSALARERALARAAGAASVNAAFGADTASRARLQGDSDTDTRTRFGADESTGAKAKSDDGGRSD